MNGEHAFSCHYACLEENMSRLSSLCLLTMFAWLLLLPPAHFCHTGFGSHAWLACSLHTDTHTGCIERLSVSFHTQLFKVACSLHAILTTGHVIFTKPCLSTGAHMGCYYRLIVTVLPSHATPMPGFFPSPLLLLPLLTCLPSHTVVCLFPPPSLLLSRPSPSFSSFLPSPSPPPSVPFFLSSPHYCLTVTCLFSASQPSSLCLLLVCLLPTNSTWLTAMPTMLFSASLPAIFLLFTLVTQHHASEKIDCCRCYIACHIQVAHTTHSHCHIHITQSTLS